MISNISGRTVLFRTTISALTLCAVLGGYAVLRSTDTFAGTAYAATAEEPEHEGSGAGGPPEGKGGHDEEEGEGGHNVSGAGGPPAGKGAHDVSGAAGQGGPSDDSDAKGPQYGSPAGNEGGKPSWAQEGIPEVELGRLSVARSPDQVLDRAYAEALNSFSADMAILYNMSLNEAILALSTQFDTLTFIDSPLQNLALLRDALDGSSVLNTLPGVSNDVDTLMAIFLGVASDKNIEISTETALAVSILLGNPLSEADAAALAADAEAIRIAVLAGHG